MAVVNRLNDNHKINEAWHKFKDTGSIERGILTSTIHDSWIRSYNLNIDPHSDVVEKELGPEALEVRMETLRWMLRIAKPFLETLFLTVGDMGFVVRFTDADGYVLASFGEDSVFENNKSLHLFKGTNVSEDAIGTNAIGISIKKKIPVQVMGSEHYRKIYHQWTSSAAPIKDATGDVIGVISMSGHYKLVHPHTLGMVMAAAQAIEHEVELENINTKLKIANEHSSAIMESISEGLLCVDENGDIRDINRFARKLLGIKRTEIHNRKIDEILSKKESKKIMKDIKNGLKYEDEEIKFISKYSGNINCLLNITPINVTYSEDKEALITFRESKKVLDLVNKIVGSTATFTLDDIIGESEQIIESVKMAKLVADTEATILLHGESGTGKELFAQGIHNASKRRDKSFIFLNCGAIPRDLVASELFGYEEGAFTGAKKGGHPGKFELSEGGTIFLDEIGDMPLDAQVNLLRVLETKQVMRVGGHDVIPVDIRVIAASHKDLSKEVELGNFRQDLYYRLKVLPIYIPALRERKNDIRLMTDFFLKSITEKLGSKQLDVSESFYVAMEDYHWPGNVRELQNVIQLVVNLPHERGILVADDLPVYMSEEKEGVSAFENYNQKSERPKRVRTMASVEKEAIENAIMASKGNLVKTAKILGIGRSTLYRKIEKYEIGV